MEKDIMASLYTTILPAMKRDGLEDTPGNRHAYLIGVRHAYQESTEKDFQSFLIVEALTNEIIRLGDEIPT